MADRPNREFPYTTAQREVQELTQKLSEINRKINRLIQKERKIQRLIQERSTGQDHGEDDKLPIATGGNPLPGQDSVEDDRLSIAEGGIYTQGFEDDDSFLSSIQPGSTSPDIISIEEQVPAVMKTEHAPNDESGYRTGTRHETSQMTGHSAGDEQEVSGIFHQEEDFQSKHLFSDEDRNEQPTPAGQHFGSRSACNVKVNQPGQRNEYLDDMLNHNDLLYGGIVDRGPPPDVCASGSDNPQDVPASTAVDSDPPDLQRLVLAQERGETEDRGTPPHICTSGSGNPHDVATFPGVDTDPPGNPPESVAVQERGFRPVNVAVSPAVDTDPPANIPETAAVQEEEMYQYMKTYFTAREEDLHQCKDCGRRFQSRDQMTRHRRNVHGPTIYYPHEAEGCRFRCPKTRAYLMRRHLFKCHESNGTSTKGKDRRPAHTNHKHRTTTTHHQKPTNTTPTDNTSITETTAATDTNTELPLYQAQGHLHQQHQIRP